MARGHIRPRGKALEVRVFAGQVDGHKRYLTRTIRWQGSKKATKALAEAELTKLLGELDQGAHTGPDATLNTLLDRWLRQKSPAWSPSTAPNYESLIAAHIRDGLGREAVRKIRTEDIDRFAADLRRAGLAPASRAKIIGILRSAFRQAVRWNWIARSPVDQAEPVKVPRKQMSVPDAAQIRKLIELARDGDPDKNRKGDPDWGTFLHLDAVTGLRRGELCGLRWEDLDGNRLTVRRGIVRAAGNRIEVKDSPKSSKPRTVLLDKATVKLLKDHRRRCAERALACGVKADGFVFSDEVDGSRPWNPTAVTKRFVRLRKKAGLEGVRLHDIRHYVASHLLDAGVPAATVAERLGHAHEGVTHAIYSHPVAGRAQVAADTAAKVLRG